MDKTWKIDEAVKVRWKASMSGRHRVYVNDEEVYSKMHFGFTAQPELRLPGGRWAIIKASYSGFVMDADLTINGEVMVPEGLEKRKCPSCRAESAANDKFCQSCGKELPDKVDALRKDKVSSAAGAIYAMSILFVISAVLLGLLQYNQAEKGLAAIAHMDASAPFPTPIEGRTYTVGELRQQIMLEVWGVVIVNIILAVITFALGIWAKRKPLAAIMMASAVYAAVIVGNAIIDPRTVGQGIILKVIIISLLVKGMRAALDLRKANA